MSALPLLMLVAGAVLVVAGVAAFDGRAAAIVAGLLVMVAGWDLGRDVEGRP